MSSSMSISSPYYNSNNNSYDTLADAAVAWEYAGNDSLSRRKRVKHEITPELVCEVLREARDAKGEGIQRDETRGSGVGSGEGVSASVRERNPFIFDVTTRLIARLGMQVSDNIMYCVIN